ncbi:hypothetical protein PIB30_076103 [Stylosanthes scabra]|uniref:Ubiquitin-like domain-containing protein n=1 Tax=Stylosanthes scabra TaxID=79078 RepID=A0ABU6YNZ4_9FABA|nr:hypothetical protein [Stylosanthes scabra]
MPRTFGTGLIPPIRPLDRMGFVSYVTTIHNWFGFLYNDILFLKLRNSELVTRAAARRPSFSALVKGAQSRVPQEVPQGSQETVLGIKRKIEQIHGTPAASQILTIFGWELIDGLDMEDYPIFTKGTKTDLNIKPRTIEQGKARNWWRPSDSADQVIHNGSIKRFTK